MVNMLPLLAIPGSGTDLTIHMLLLFRGDNGIEGIVSPYIIKYKSGKKAKVQVIKLISKLSSNQTCPHTFEITSHFFKIWIV